MEENLCKLTLNRIEKYVSRLIANYSVHSDFNTFLVSEKIELSEAECQSIYDIGKVKSTEGEGMINEMREEEKREVNEKQKLSSDVKIQEKEVEVDGLRDQRIATAEEEAVVSISGESSKRQFIFDELAAAIKKSKDDLAGAKDWLEILK